MKNIFLVCLLLSFSSLSFGGESVRSATHPFLNHSQDSSLLSLDTLDRLLVRLYGDLPADPDIHDIMRERLSNILLEELSK